MVPKHSWDNPGSGSKKSDFYLLSKNLLNGYQKIRELNKEELKQLPILCSGSALRFLLTRLADWKVSKGDAMVTPKNPDEFVKILDFHRDINNSQDYGA